MKIGKIDTVVEECAVAYHYAMREKLTDKATYARINGITWYKEINDLPDLPGDDHDRLWELIVARVMAKHPTEAEAS